MGEQSLKIIAYEKPSGAKRQQEIGHFTVMFNPATFVVNNKIEYKKNDTKGQNGGDPQFEKIPPIEFTVEFTIDGTGVGLNSNYKEQDSDVQTSPKNEYVRNKIRKLREVTGSKINGEIHRPNYLAILWGTFYIECVITALNITYNLFDGEGAPLRAKVSCGFLERIGPGRDGRQSRLESPDLTKYITVMDGDTLPLIANTYYDDPAYYIQIAKVNKLNSFRNLVPGTKLVLPPMNDDNE